MTDEKPTTDDERADMPDATTPLGEQDDTEWKKHTPHATLGVDGPCFQADAFDLGDGHDETVSAALAIAHHDDSDARVALRVQLAAERDGRDVSAEGRLEITPEQARGLARRLEEIAEFVEDGEK